MSTLRTSSSRASWLASRGSISQKLRLLIPTYAITFAAILLLSSCTSLAPANLNLTKTSFAALDGWGDNDHAKSLSALLKSCEKFAKLPHGYSLGYPAGKAGDWLPICKKAAAISAKHARSFFESNFTPHLVTYGRQQTGLFTGYYEPEINGSLVKKAPYIYPIYKKPNSKWFAGLPRKRIENGAYEGKDLEIAYVDDPVELFFLHVQGSGRIRLNNGSVMKIGYAGQNGHDYTSLGRYLADAGIFELEEVTAQKIKAYLREDLARAKRIMNQNASYIFFRKLKTANPIGGQGVELTPEYSLAVDKRFIPYGLPIWLETDLADGAKFHRLMIAQDTGGAIKGAIRGDIFLGAGKQAQHMAGLLKQEGRYFMLVPR